MSEIINRDELARVLARIDARIDDGVGAARYDGDGGHSSGRPDSHPEKVALNTRPDPVSEKANNDLHALQQAVRTVTEVCAAYPSITAGQRTIPGLTPCPPGRCAVHWAAGISIAAVKNPKRTRCRRCHEFTKDHGEDYPPLVLRAVSDLGGTSGPLGQKVWDNQKVLRAWDASGWIAKPEPRKRTA